MTTKYNILITGVAGFLGSHLSEKLLGLGHKVIGIDNMIGGYEDNIHKDIEFHNLDCSDFSKVKKIMKNIDIVYHCAATAHEGCQYFHLMKSQKIITLLQFQFFLQQLMKK